MLEELFYVGKVLKTGRRNSAETSLTATTYQSTLRRNPKVYDIIFI